MAGGQAAAMAVGTDRIGGASTEALPAPVTLPVSTAIKVARLSLRCFEILWTAVLLGSSRALERLRLLSWIVP